MASELLSPNNAGMLMAITENAANRKIAGFRILLHGLADDHHREERVQRQGHDEDRKYEAGLRSRRSASQRISSRYAPSRRGPDGVPAMV